MKKKVLLITNIPSPYNVDLFYYLQKNVSDYDFYVLYSNTSEDNRIWTPNSDKFINTEFAKSKTFKVKTKLDYRYIHITLGISKVLDKINPSVIISWEYNPTSVKALIWSIRNKRKYISVTEGTILTEQDLWLIQKLTRKFICRKSDAFLVSSTKAKEKLIAWEVPENKIFTELLTVDLSAFKNTERKVTSNTLLYVGRMTKTKGLDLLIRAIAKVKNPFRLRIVGNGSDEEKMTLTRLAVEYGVNNYIDWCGFKSGADLVEEYSKARVFVLPSRGDCFGLVLLEALASGVPVIASKYADGAYDTLIEGKTGWIVDPYETDLFAKKIDEALMNDDMQKKCPVYSKDILKKFEYSEVSKGFTDAIDYALSDAEVLG